MKKRLIFLAVLIICCLLVIWLAVAVAGSGRAVYADGGSSIPAGHTFSPAAERKYQRDAAQGETVPQQFSLGDPFHAAKGPAGPIGSPGGTLRRDVRTGNRAEMMQRRAVYVPKVTEYEPGIDYMAQMVKAAEDGSEWAMAMGRIYEQCRNAKIDALKMDYAKTDYFGGGDSAKTVLEKLREYIDNGVPGRAQQSGSDGGRTSSEASELLPPSAEANDTELARTKPEDPRAGWQSLGVWDITAYTWTGNPCANGEYPYEGVCAVNGLPFGTVIYVDGWGYLTVADRGGMDGWYDVDIYLESEAACWEYGRRAREVWIVEG